MKYSRILLCGAILYGTCAMSCSSHKSGVAVQAANKSRQAGNRGPSSVKQRVIRTAYSPVALFPESGSFSFARLSKLPADPRAREAELEGQLRQAIILEMTSKGYTFGGGVPRLLFSIDVEYHGAEPSQENSTLELNEYERVSGVVTITAPKSKDVLWRGLYEGAVVVEVDKQERNAQVRDGISQMFRDFPPSDGLIVP